MAVDETCDHSVAAADGVDNLIFWYINIAPPGIALWIDHDCTVAAERDDNPFDARGEEASRLEDLFVRVD